MWNLTFLPNILSRLRETLLFLSNNLRGQGSSFICKSSMAILPSDLPVINTSDKFVLTLDTAGNITHVCTLVDLFSLSENISSYCDPSTTANGWDGDTMYIC